MSFSTRATSAAVALRSSGAGRSTGTRPIGVGSSIVTVLAASCALTPTGGVLGLRMSRSSTIPDRLSPVPGLPATGRWLVTYSDRCLLLLDVSGLRRGDGKVPHRSDRGCPDDA